MSTIFQRETTFTPAPAASPPLPSMLWIPPDEMRQAWASFGAEALSGPALLATSNAFLALSWEASALQHHHMAHHAQQGGFSQEAAHWLDQVVLDLDEAIRDWQCVHVWLERLATTSSGSDRPQTHIEPIAQVRALSEQVAAQQQRLRRLLGQVQHEQGACGRGGQAGAPVTPATTVNAAAGMAAAVQGEERVTWPSD